MEGKHYAFNDSKHPTKVVLHFRRVRTVLIRCHHSFHAFPSMSPLVSHYLRHAGRGRGGSNSGYDGIGPIYSSTPYKQQGPGLGTFLGDLFRYVKPILWSSEKNSGRSTLKTLGRWALRNGVRILADIADNTSPDTRAHDIVSIHRRNGTKPYR
jgi:hypothetical protein